MHKDETLAPRKPANKAIVVQHHNTGLLLMVDATEAITEHARS